MSETMERRVTNRVVKNLKGFLPQLCPECDGQRVVTSLGGVDACGLCCTKAEADYQGMKND